jgi:uncharacterized protein YifE (UPF0438 family)
VSYSHRPQPDDEDAGRITQEDILHWVRSYVWSGEYDAEEIPLLIEDNLGDEDEVDETWLRKVIRKEVAAKRAAEKTWPKVTDCDRLDRAFDTLERQGVIALHRAGYTQSDGLNDVAEAYREAGGEKSKYAGHCFYTEQDQEGALDGHGMYVGFGHLSGDDAKGVEVGQMLRAALEHEGFNVEWNGTIGSRLFVKGFRWQRRSPR